MTNPTSRPMAARPAELTAGGIIVTVGALTKAGLSPTLSLIAAVVLAGAPLAVSTLRDRRRAPEDPGDRILTNTPPAGDSAPELLGLDCEGL